MEKIDVVYLWVDGNDSEWRAIKQKWQTKILGQREIYPEAMADARWADNDELRYSLRSVEKCIPWANHIYIVTGFGQVPKWLRRHPKITIVPHSQIMPHDAIPTFNATAIEMCIANIPGLAERFLLMNDDVFFGCPLGPEYFFDRRGRAIVWYEGKMRTPMNTGFALECKSDYMKTIVLSNMMINRVFGTKLFGIRPAHGIDPYFKSTFLAARRHPQFQEKINAQIRNKFRTVSEVQRWIFNLYDWVHGRAVLRRVHHRKRVHGIASFLHNIIYRYNIEMSTRYATDAVRDLCGRVPPIFCINDVPATPNAVKRSNHRFLDNLYPEKSCFEK